jgi:uncharacterized protein (DUF2235 family)
MTDVIAPRVRAVENMVARAQAATKGPNSQGACLTCEVKLWLSFFFDGTGNHKSLHFPVKHSNVAALMDAHESDRASGVESFYYEGIGMPFEFKDRYVVSTRATRGGAVKVEQKGWKEDESGWNMAFGKEGDKRLERAMFDFEYFVEEWRRKRRVDEINVSAFGFSRGAATARAFMHWLRAHSKVTASGAKLFYDGIPVNVKFLGAFDTVESIGTAGDNDEPELIKTSVPTFVQKAFQVIAAHELRHAFPITVFGTNRYKQVVFPGAHADIGGGYAEGDQSRHNKLPRIGLLQMLDEARAAGLKMLSVGEMQADGVAWNSTFKYSFNVEQSTRDAFSGYMKYVTKQSGELRAVFQSHCDLYQKWIDAGLAIEDADQKLKAARANPNLSSRADAIATERFLLSNLARSRKGRGATIDGPPDHRAVPAEVELLFENYVHDSFQHFSLSGGSVQKDFSTADYYKLRNIHAPKA